MISSCFESKVEGAPAALGPGRPALGLSALGLPALGLSALGVRLSGVMLAALLAAAPVAAAGGAQEHFQVVRSSFSKKVRFQDLSRGETVTMKYKGIPWSRGSAVNLVADPSRYEKNLNRVRYRFAHPLSGRLLTLQARSTSHQVRNVPVRSENTAPTVEVFETEDGPAVAAMSYDFHSKILFAGRLREQPVEIERVSEDTPLDRGLLKYFLFPFPVTGEYEVRIGGKRVAGFTQLAKKGTKAPYELFLSPGLEPREREDAMLAFIVFDLMGDFVTGAD